MIEFHDFVSSYARSAGLNNVICFMPFQLSGIKNRDGGSRAMAELDISRICRMENIDNIGTDPYWYGNKEIAENGGVYGYVYDVSRAVVECADKFGKDHNVWIQGYNAPRGREEEIIEATEAAYDAGARTILSWSFNAGESNNYRSSNPAKSWLMTLEGFKRIKNMERDRILEENRKKYRK